MPQPGRPTPLYRRGNDERREERYDSAQPLSVWLRGGLSVRPGPGIDPPL